jgi:hypothetical protein
MILKTGREMPVKIPHGHFKCFQVKDTVHSTMCNWNEYWETRQTRERWKKHKNTRLHHLRCQFQEKKYLVWHDTTTELILIEDTFLHMTLYILHKAYKKAMLVEGKETAAVFKYSTIHLMSLMNWRRINAVFVNKIRIKKRLGSLAMTNWSTKGIRKKRPHIKNIRKKVAEAKVYKPLNVASFWSAMTPQSVSTILQQEIWVLELNCLWQWNRALFFYKGITCWKKGMSWNNNKHMITAKKKWNMSGDMKKLMQYCTVTTVAVASPRSNLLLRSWNSPLKTGQQFRVHCFQ